MSFEFSKGYYYARIWFAGNQDIDWLCAVYRETDTSPWLIRYRFRYHSKTNLLSDDEKSWWSASAQPHENLEDILSKLSLMIDVVRMRLSDVFSELRPETSDSGKLLELLSKQSWSCIVIPDNTGNIIEG